MIDDDLWFAPILMQDHARPRVRERLGWDPEDPRVIAEVRLGLLEGRSSESQPPWTGGSRREPAAKERSRLYVWDEAATRCWVLTRTPSSLLFVTVLLDLQVWRSQNERNRLVRAGSARR